MAVIRITTRVCPEHVGLENQSITSTRVIYQGLIRPGMTWPELSRFIQQARRKFDQNIALDGYFIQPCLQSIYFIQLRSAMAEAPYPSQYSLTSNIEPCPCLGSGEALLNHQANGFSLEFIRVEFRTH